MFVAIARTFKKKYKLLKRNMAKKLNIYGWIFSILTFDIFSLTAVDNIY